MKPLFLHSVLMETGQYQSRVASRLPAIFSVGTVSDPGALSLSGISKRFSTAINEVAQAIPGEMLRFSKDGATWNANVASMLSTFTVTRRTATLQAYAAHPGLLTILNADLDGDGSFTAADIDAFSAILAAGTNDLSYNFDFSDFTIDDDDKIALIHFYFGTFFGDSNLNGSFNSQDFVVVFQVGEYEDDIDGNSGWADGDWNGDADFTSGDLTFAFSFGGYDPS